MKWLDGWSWDKRAHELFYLSLFLLTASFCFKAGPMLLFVKSVIGSVALWSLQVLLATAHFRAPATLEKYSNHKMKYTAPLLRLTNFSFVLTLLLLKECSFWAYIPQNISLITILGAGLRSMDWRRVIKRSWLPSTVYVMSFYVLAVFILGTSVQAFWMQKFSYSELLSFSYFVAICGLLRMKMFHSLGQRKDDFVAACRKYFLQETSASRKLEQICRNFQEEWLFTRASLVSVKKTEGLLLTSFGSDALASSEYMQPRRLGPFMRRVCKEQHMLYAPLAEELGQDLAVHGLRHSSIAIPFLSNGNVEVVLCLMAEEEELITPSEVLLIEQTAQALSLEIINGAQQFFLETREEQWKKIVVENDALHLERIDNWGLLHSKAAASHRFLVNTNIVCHFPQHLEEGMRTQKVMDGFRKELLAHWHGMRETFEFLQKEIGMDQFLAISPKEFRSPFLRELGAEKVALVFSHFFEKHARQLAQSEHYRLLGIRGLQVLVSGIMLKQAEIEHSTLLLLQEKCKMIEPNTVTVDCEDSFLRTALRSDPMFKTSSGKTLFEQQDMAPAVLRLPEFHSLLGLSLDKKELRKLEGSALELGRNLLKKSAA